ncbi:1-deoxy-D-xylulose-5-phosphate synthase [Achromatium sp. WMS3]|nr:1-deoxy-D-xylulose-5-phosphate synthase [Achromatium sp. WMS3]
MPQTLYLADGPLHQRYPLLFQIDNPTDLRQLEETELPTLALQLRGFLIETVSQTGGHLAAGLGVVELTIALHYVLNTPTDRLVWDVGHQAYPHKILTGRRDQMHKLRCKGGISGFPRRDESPYDTFGVGHSSTSIGAALGFAIAAHQQNAKHHIVTVIGDGALGAGMAFEALNHAGALDLDLLVILNDNDMSISAPVGAISNHLAKLLSGQLYNKVREGSKSALRNMPQLKEFMGRWEEHMKGMLMPSTLFEELGFNYIGPIDGHNLHTLIYMLRNMQRLSGPRLLHVVTQKGKGYEPAEGKPVIYHGVTPFDLATGQMASKSIRPSYTQIFGNWICAAATQDPNLNAITPAMCEGSGLVEFAKLFPKRYFDVGIAEQHALTLAAGMACEGLKPVVAIYSTFLQRAYDQLIHDIALQNLDVTIAVDRAGQVGADGATHNGGFDISFARCIPNLVIMTPSNEKECRKLLQTAYQYPGPALVRYPRGTGPGILPDDTLETLPIGRGEIQREGREVALIVFGSLLYVALEVARGLNATVANMRFVKPMDRELLRDLATRHQLLVTIEENVVAGGAGSSVNEILLALGYTAKILNLGLPDHFIEHSNSKEQLAECGLDVIGIDAAIRQAMVTYQ